MLNILKVISSNSELVLLRLKILTTTIKLWGLFIIFVPIPILVLIWYMLTHAETIVTTTNKIVTPNTTTMDYTVAAVLVVGIGTILGNIFNPKVTKKLDAINNKIDTNSETNQKQHNELSTTLKDHGVMFNAILTVRDVRSCLNKIIADALVYSSDSVLSEWVSKEGKTFVAFCDETVTTGINNINCKSFKADVAVMISVSDTNTKEYLGDNFLNIIKEEHTNRIIGFRNDVLIIKSDKLMNSKVDRFRAKSEIFLQEYLASTIIAYNKFNK